MQWPTSLVAFSNCITQSKKKFRSLDEIDPCRHVEEQLSTKSHAANALEASPSSPATQRQMYGAEDDLESYLPVRKPALNVSTAVHLVPHRQGRWSQSGGKRFFDVASVVLALPVVIPVLLAAGLAVRLTSAGPVLFTQKRIGRHGRPFTIVKFRTLTHVSGNVHRPVTTTDNQRFTPVGPFLRRWKIDELPQLWNVLIGDMSLVGTRPKIPEHQVAKLKYRPGITGAATIAFAREEAILALVPKHHLDDYYREVILPAKHQLDAAYMASATFLSDLKLLVQSVLRRWDDSVTDSLIDNLAFRTGDWFPLPRASFPADAPNHAPISTGSESLVSAD